jgi:acyl-CoA thioesterase-1
MMAHDYDFRVFFTRWLAGIVLLAGIVFSLSAGAEDVSAIVVLGASNASGYGVGPGESWPARLEQLLRAKGYDVRVHVVARPGATTSETYSRIDSAVVPGTRVVVFDAYRFNDDYNGISSAQTQLNIETIKKRIRELGAIPILDSVALSSQYLRADGIHWSPEGHAEIATRLLPEVIEALGKK